MKPPSLQEVEEYVKEKKLQVDPEFFCNYYEADDWKSMGVPMKSWKQKLWTWHRKNIEKKRPHKCYCGQPGVYISGYDDTGFASWRCIDHKPKYKALPKEHIVNTIKLKSVPSLEQESVSNRVNIQRNKLAER